MAGLHRRAGRAPAPGVLLWDLLCHWGPLRYRPRGVGGSRGDFLIDLGAPGVSLGAPGGVWGIPEGGLGAPGGIPKRFWELQVGFGGSR